MLRNNPMNDFGFRYAWEQHAFGGRQERQIGWGVVQERRQGAGHPEVMPGFGHRLDKTGHRTVFSGLEDGQGRNDRHENTGEETAAGNGETGAVEGEKGNDVVPDDAGDAPEMAAEYPDPNESSEDSAGEAAGDVTEAESVKE